MQTKGGKAMENRIKAQKGRGSDDFSETTAGDSAVKTAVGSFKVRSCKKRRAE